ncbi:hypothetical protein M0R89_18355 (plasmid) [Halorussus limi]|uniref:Uncharacterized protein n=1 Tax=Halorussus limi TaxID=2938695 RepID=A0A8U0HZZ1_9EURY|nr:hypothetical protein [Halorussus limi]UPV76497.1 hypothetical protein M0R89_18355 [Halorussus limi]
MTMLFGDGAFGLETLVYPVVRLVEPLFGDGHLVWGAGRVVTFYLFVLAVGSLVAAGRSRDPPGNRPRDPPSDSESTR